MPGYGSSGAASDSSELDTLGAHGMLGDTAKPAGTLAPQPLHRHAGCLLSASRALRDRGRKIERCPRIVAKRRVIKGRCSAS